jgi:hypothetical protein
MTRTGDWTFCDQNAGLPEHRHQRGSQTIIPNGDEIIQPRVAAVRLSMN